MTNNIICRQIWQWVIVVTLLSVLSFPAQSTIPDNLDYQGYLTDSGGSPINNTVSVTFSLYNVELSGIALWSDTQSVTVSEGLFTVKLGGAGSPSRYAGSEAVIAIMAADGAGSTLDADLLDGNDSSTFASTVHTHTGSLYSKVAVVAQSWGDYTSPLDAMKNLATWCGIPAVTNPCLLRILPGIYNLGNNVLTMQAFDIEGSGENATTITSTHSSGSFNANSATVVGANNAEIHFITVNNQGGGFYAIAVYNNSVSPKITNVTASASASGGTYSLGCV